MVKLLIVKISEISSSSKETTEKMKMIQKVALMPMGTKLEDLHAEALSCMKRAQHGWILDSGASKHVTGAPDEFISYTPYPSNIRRPFKLLMGHVNLSKAVVLSSVPHQLLCHQFCMSLLFLLI